VGGGERIVAVPPLPMPPPSYVKFTTRTCLPGLSFALLAIV